MSGKIKFKNQKEFENVWKSGGVYVKDNGDVVNIPLRDSLEYVDSPIWVSKTITTMVREAAEPMLTITPLYEVINTKPGVDIKIMNMESAAAVGDINVADDQDYPSLKLDRAGATASAIIGKMGIKFYITDEMKQNSQYDVVSMHIRAATRVIARNIELKAYNELSKQGIVTHDNLNPASSEYGTTTGRKITGVSNGSMTIDDIVDAYSVLMQAGFHPDTLIITPLLWAHFMKDPIMRQLALTAGSSWYYGPHSGTPGTTQWNDPVTISGYPNPVGKPTSMSELLGNNTMGFQLPTYSPYPIRVLVSHFMPVRVTGVNNTRVTDVILCDSAQVGYRVVAENLTVDQNIDWDKESTAIRLKTKQGFLVKNEGKGIAVMKNISIEGDSLAVPPMGTINIQDSNVEIDRNTPIGF